MIGSRYTAESVLGRGAFGTVWRGRGPDGSVAIKVVHASAATDPEVVARFVRERSILVGVDHPGLVRVHDLIVDGDTLALVMDLVEGPTLRERLRQAGPLAPAEAADMVAAIAESLSAAHAAGIVHRDIKPENVLLSPAPLLADFGIARLLQGTSITRSGTVLGTPTYMAPETIAGGTPTGAADVYALGIILYELVTGAPPFAGEHPLAVLRAHAEQELARPAAFPDELWPIVTWCLAKAPQDRPDAARLASLLGAYGSSPASPIVAGPGAVTTAQSAEDRHAEGTSVLTEVVPVEPEDPTPPRNGTRRVVIGAGAVMLALVAALAVAATRLGSADPGSSVGATAAPSSPAPATQTPSAQTGYLSDWPSTSIANGLGPVALNAAVGGAELDDGGPITLGGVEHAHGLGVHANSHVRYYIGGVCTSLTATVGIDAEVAGGGGSVVFKVLADGALVHESGLLTHADPPQQIAVDLTGASTLDLVVEDGGDGTDFDHADWADPSITCTW
ncbi:NPCBM/NEW2 domain-containing protein [Nonomuraea sp. NBC_00507]|uniref:protein kinase domain-containing protein n=1 Tax=Nonomuraea sp. NBC_00507 TaxID=2976002 RepID=UPI002E186E33